MGSFVVIVFISPTAYLQANIVAKILGAMAGFLLHKYVSFSWMQRDRTGRQVFFFILLLLGNLCLSTLLLYIGALLLGLPEIMAKIVADIVVIATTFILGRILIFRAAR